MQNKSQITNNQVIDRTQQEAYYHLEQLIKYNKYKTYAMHFIFPPLAGDSIKKNIEIFKTIIQESCGGKLIYNTAVRAVNNASKINKYLTTSYVVFIVLIPSRPDNNNHLSLLKLQKTFKEKSDYLRLIITKIKKISTILSQNIPNE